MRVGTGARLQHRRRRPARRLAAAAAWSPPAPRSPCCGPAATEEQFGFAARGAAVRAGGDPGEPAARPTPARCGRCAGRSPRPRRRGARARAARRAGRRAGPPARPCRWWSPGTTRCSPRGLRRAVYAPARARTSPAPPTSRSAPRRPGRPGPRARRPRRPARRGGRAGAAARRSRAAGEVRAEFGADRRTSRWCSRSAGCTRRSGTTCWSTPPPGGGAATRPRSW